MPITFEQFKNSGSSRWAHRGGWFTSPQNTSVILINEPSGWSPVSATVRGWTLGTNSAHAQVQYAQFVVGGTTIASLQTTANSRVFVGSLNTAIAAVSTVNVAGAGQFGAICETASIGSPNYRLNMGLYYSTDSAECIFSIGGAGGGGTATNAPRGLDHTFDARTPSFDYCGIGATAQGMEPKHGANELNVQVPMPIAGTLRNFTVVVWSGPALFPADFTVRVNCQDTAQVISVSPTAVSVFRSAEIASFGASALLSMRIHAGSWGSGSYMTFMAMWTFRKNT